MKVVVVGQGYVGLPVALRCAKVGLNTVGFDRDKFKVESLLRGSSYIDDVSDRELRETLAGGNYLPSYDSSDIGGFDVAVIAVPTPLKSREPNLSYIIEATRTIARSVHAGCTVILESTSYPGTTDEIVIPILEEDSGLRAGVDFHVGYSPERVDPGNTEFNLVNTPKIVAGLTNNCLVRVKHFYDLLVSETVEVSGLREAELSKLLENTFRQVNIALINELAVHMHSLGIDIWEAIRAASTKPFGFMPFFPGPGVGGHCLPIDPTYLSWKIAKSNGSPSKFIELANQVNSSMPAYIVHRLTEGLDSRGIQIQRARILVLGISYKKNSSDAREAPSRDLVQYLIDAGASVIVHDTHVESFPFDDRVEKVELTPAEISAADAVVLVTDHDDIDYELIDTYSKYTLDTRHRLNSGAVEYL